MKGVLIYDTYVFGTDYSKITYFATNFPLIPVFDFQFCIFVVIPFVLLVLLVM